MNHIWVIEVWTGKCWEPTVGVALWRKTAVNERKVWESKNPDDRFRVVKYICSNVSGQPGLARTTKAVSGDFYGGIEWFACWLLDYAEGETIAEEQLRPWAVRAWKKHFQRNKAGHT